MEFCARCLLLELGLLECSLAGELLQLLPDLIVFRLDMHEVALASVEVMLVLTAVEASIVLLDDLCLLVEEL